ncbi:hypothetical protein ACP4OV_022846 [Aristida adscensionis]
MVLSDGSHGFGTGSAESLPSKRVNPDFEALEILSLEALRRSTQLHNERLHMKPEDIPGPSRGFGIKYFYSDNLDLLTLDKIDTPHGSWKLPDRGQGWGISLKDAWYGWKRTFVFKPSQPGKSNKAWRMIVYSIFSDDKYIKPLYRCEIFEVSNSYDPRPKCVSLFDPTGYDLVPLQADPETESFAQYLEAMGTNPNLLPFVEHQDYKKEKFQTIRARGPDGKDIKWSICNHCGMVYKGIPNKAVQDNHKCKCGCNLAPNS